MILSTLSGLGATTSVHTLQFLSFGTTSISTNGGTPLWAILLPTLVVVGGVFYRYTKKFLTQKRRFWTLMLGVPKERGLPATPGLIEKLESLLQTFEALDQELKRTAKLADRANRAAIAAHRRLDRANISMDGYHQAVESPEQRTRYMAPPNRSSRFDIPPHDDMDDFEEDDR